MSDRSRSRSRLRRRLLVVAASLAAVPLLAACSTISLRPVSVVPGPQANTVACADVIVHLPNSLGAGLGMRDTDSQGTAAWGSPSAVLLRCGVTTPTISPLTCVTVDGVDWLIDTKGDYQTYVSYGRTPGVEVIADTKKQTGNVLFDLASAVGGLPVSKKCESVGGS